MRTFRKIGISLDYFFADFGFALTPVIKINGQELGWRDGLPAIRAKRLSQRKKTGLQGDRECVDTSAVVN